MAKKDVHTSNKKPQASIFSLLKPYKGFVAALAICTILGNAVSLIVPRLISKGIDSYSAGTLAMKALSIEFVAVALAVLVFTYLQGVSQTYLSERAARDIRNKLAEKISKMSFSVLEKETPAKLLTNLTSDIDSVKMFVSMAVVNLISSVILIIGAASLLLYTDWKLALAVLALLPLIGILFFVIFGKLRSLFMRGQEIIDRINSIISESIVGAALVRVLRAESIELSKFGKENTDAKDTGMNVLKYFSFMIPSVGIIANLAILVILALGGKFVIGGEMTLGELAAFNSYVYILIFPIMMLGFISNIVSRAQASYSRIQDVFTLEDEKDRGGEKTGLEGDIEVRNVTLAYGEKDALKNVAFKIKAGTKTAIIGPTAAGKTQLLHLLIGLIKPTKGEVLYGGKAIESYSKEALHSNVAIVFQDSVMFNMTLRENISFNLKSKDEDAKKAIETAELSDFVSSLPQGLDTMASERGTSLSGGQKQRIMLARALALNPKVLLLDDFTARVDQETEKRILSNIEKNYPDITIVSVTQKIRSVEAFDKIILLMEGEKLAEGTHGELAESSLEYNEIMESQKSTQSYEKVEQ